MILLSELLDEDSEAAAQAKQMGLVSKGWGRWADPRTGKVTHKTDGARLVAVDPQQQEPSGGQEPDLDRVAKDLGDKPKSKYDDPKYKKGDWWDDPDFDQKMMAKTSADRALKVANKSGPAVEDALNRHGVGDNWGGNVSWQHDPETGEVDGYDDEGGEYGSIRALGSGRYMVRKPGQKYGEGDKVKGLGDAVKALSAAVGDRYGDEPDEPESKPDDVETRTKEMFSAATKKMQNAKTPEEQRNTKQFLSNHQMIMQKFNNSLQDLGHSPDPEPEELQSLTDKNPEVKQELDKMNKLMLKNLQLYLDA